MSAATTIDGPALPQVADHQYLAVGDFTSVGTQKSKHDPDDGRFFRPVGDDQGNHLACLHGDVDVGNDLAVAELDDLAAHLNQRFTGFPRAVHLSNRLPRLGNEDTAPPPR